MAMMFAIRPLIASIQSFAFIGYLLSCSDNTIIEYLCRFVERRAAKTGQINKEYRQPAHTINDRI